MKKQSSMSRLFEYAGNFRWLTIASWILAAGSSIIALMPFMFIFKIIKEVLISAPDFSSAQNLAHNGWMAVLFAALSLFIYVSGLMCSHVAAFRIAANIRTQTMQRIVTLPMGLIDSFGTGKMRKIINESSAATETYLAHQLPDKAGAIATPMGLLFLLFYFDWRLGLLSLLPVVLAFAVMMSMTGSKMKLKMKEYQNSLEDMSNEAVEYVRGIPVVKTFGQTVFSFKRFKGSIDRYGKWVISYTRDLRMPMIIYTTAINSVFAFLIAAALYFTKQGITNDFLYNLIFYIIITPAISTTLTKIMMSSENAMIVEDALQRIDSIFALKPLSEPQKAAHPKDASIELKNVSFSYDGKQQAVQDINLKIHHGQHVAFVGPSGGGKTTLAALISRCFDVNSGSILIGGTDIRNIPKAELMNTVAFVFQDSKLLKNTIFENVRLSKPDATREQVLAALKAAQCMDIIEKMPNGIDTVVGTKGVFLSGGEQQRISIARVMLKDAPIVILDEATAFADPDNESRVQAAFAALSSQKTVLTIAHRLTTVTKSDKIFVLENGQIVQQGTHDELFKQNGLYADMWEKYQVSAQWKVGKEASIC